MGSTLFDLTGKVALVTGGGRGLGKAMALGLAEAGAKLVVAARSRGEVEASAAEIAAAGGEALAVTCDATDRGQVQAMIETTLERFGDLDIMVVNHGVAAAAPAESLDAETWTRTIEVNMTGAFNCAQAAARCMIDKGHGGSIIVTSSTASLVGFEGLLAYGASKGGVDQMVRQMAVEWGPKDIRVNAVNPGYTANHMRGSEARHADPELEAELRRMTPMGRRGEVSEFVGPVIFLASDAASFVSGITLPVDGGYCAK
jgi:NAD(P)-dependent dehydrogenase (short-subunit alcohol dehydrogenase family)